MVIKRCSKYHNSAARIEEALSTRLGVSARVIVLTMAELAAVNSNIGFSTYEYDFAQ